MTISGDCLQGRSQHFTFPRRELLQGLAAVGLPFLVPRVQPASPSKRPLPVFNIGDLVAQDWEGNEDEDAPQSATDFGEVVGLCYLPEDGSYYPRDTWVYYIYWTHSTCSECSYPCFDGEPTAGNTLRLVSHG
ncbi:hypothetical protein [Microcoleus asticus]|uniref:Uncharacterized protein n=1 Tax=Microcoleus asticus IPMA8 TaxID=2563858 RepID=A0ABX2D8Q4_9CYAN|nr:hypothetical protein [Microcoleus asticus]NQE38203.1 hypothetical protein [Microcoleus asticus IPMA8]